jgi:integrase
MKFHETLRDWCDYRNRLCSLGLVATSTWNNQTAICTGIGKTELGQVDTDAIRKSHIETWMGERLQTCAPVTVRGELNVIRQVFNWCIDEQVLTIKPRLPTLSAPTVQQTLPSDEAFKWILANVPAHHARALEFMMLTGLSPHELERVQVQDQVTRPKRGSIIRADQRGKPVEFTDPILGIGQRADFAVKQPSRRRWMPLNDRAMQIWLEDAGGSIDPCRHVFPTVEAMQKAIRRSFTPDTFQQAIDMPLGVHTITPKMMRKWFASKVANDHPEHVLQRLLGHAPGSPITARHYVRSTDAQTRDASEGVTL